jgi:hypothetical protein
MDKRKIDMRAVNCNSSDEAKKLWNEYYKNGFTWNDMPLDFLKKFFYSTYREIMQSY